MFLSVLHQIHVVWLCCCILSMCWAVRSNKRRIYILYGFIDSRSIELRCEWCRNILWWAFNVNLIDFQSFFFFFFLKECHFSMLVFSQKERKTVFKVPNRVILPKCVGQISWILLLLFSCRTYYDFIEDVAYGVVSVWERKKKIGGVISTASTSYARL